MTTSIKSKTQILIFLLLSQLFSTAVNAQLVDSIGMKGLEIKTIHSKLLGEDRRIYIQTPANMKPYDAYPVLYVLDGETFMTMIGGQVQYLSEAYKIIPSMIIVGIENTDRIRDLTPTHSAQGHDGKPDTSANAFGKNSGGGEKFLQFIKTELMPVIESSYRTVPYKIFAGHSLGGLMAVNCLISHPDFFNAYIAISPSLQWDNEVILKQVVEKPVSANKILFFSDANEDVAFHKNQLKLDSFLKQKNINGFIYKRFFYPEETHLSEPVKAFYDGLRLVYPNWYLPYNSSAFKKTMTARMIIEHYRELTKKYGYNVIPPLDEVNQISRFLRNDPKRIQDAIELLKMNAINFPSSAAIHETLGDTYLKAGDPKNALISYQEASTIDPKNEKLLQKIKSMDK
jgi:Predicted hydrolase of the alpha/beta superfamily